MIEFQWLWAFALLPLPLLVRWLVPAARTPRAGALRVPFFGEMQASGFLTIGNRRGRLFRLLVLTLIWLLLVCAAARPAYVGRPVPLPVEGRDMMLAVDLSGSMARKDFAQDGQPTDRLSVVKAVADAFIASRQGDRVGLILFSSRAYVQAPLTFDRNVVRNLLGSSSIGLTGQETAIGDAIGLAVKILRERPAEQRVLVLLTDGANTAGVLEPLAAAEAAQQEHVKIYTIGVGADRLASGQRVVNPSADLDEGTLAKIAEMTGGRYFRARDTAGLARIYADINRMEPSAGEPRYLSPTVSLFQWPLGASLVLALVFGIGQALPRFSRGARPVQGAAGEGARP
ncbi:VWA domain-containing protein [Aquabacter cavernae]|uniref:VWA domain-containing protein n=1 Tax=Aquabacter cavernae TaxID=2496029 RepID=UPI000F8D2002|nr:VWA domain-containing protein [Aquabacter cavernae]